MSKEGKTFILLHGEITFSPERIEYFDIRCQFKSLAEQCFEEAVDDFYTRFSDFSTMANGIESWIYEFLRRGADLVIKILASHGHYEIDQDRFIREYFEISRLNAASARINEFIASQNLEAEQQEALREARTDAAGSSWFGGGFGLEGALKGAAMAYALNAVSAGVSELYNNSERGREDQRHLAAQEAFFNDPQTSFAFAQGIYDGLAGMILDLFKYIENNKITIEIKPMTVDEVSRANSIISNVKNHVIPEEKIEEQCRFALALDPLNTEIYKYVSVKFQDSMPGILEMDEFFDVRELHFLVKCPCCHRKLIAQIDWIGRDGECPECGAKITIKKKGETTVHTASDGVSSASNGMNTAQSERIHDIQPEQEMENINMENRNLLTSSPENFNGAAQVQGLNPDEISCPYCGATIKKAAKLCRFCHRELHHAVGGGATYNQPILSMCKECGSFIKTTSSRIGQSMACPMCGEDMVIEKAENRTCPSCGESIKIEAKICKFCHSPLPPINAIGEKGNKIESMYSSALLQSDLVFPVPDAALRNEMSDLWKKLHLWFILGCSSLFLGGLTVAILIGIPILIFYIVASVFVIIFNCKLLYRYWKYVGPKPGYTPGQMVGFLFIPFFNFYWNFEVFWKLAKKINAAGYHEVSSGLALTYCILTCLTWVPFLNFLVALAMIVIFEILYRQFDQVFVGKEQ